MTQGKKIAIIGVGKIGGTLVKGLLESRMVEPNDLVGSTAHEEHAIQVTETYGIRTYLDNAAMVAGRDIIILAVKPQVMEKVLVEIRDAVTEEQLIISLAAAITTGFITEKLGKRVPVIRAMPNTPCLVNQGMTVLCPGEYAKEADIELAKRIFASTGLVEVIDDEGLMDAVTGLSGSGPAYAYIIIEALAEGGVKAGLPRRLATILAAQSLLGGAKMVLETGEHPAKLKDMVTTPAGVTIDGLIELEDGGLRVALIKAVNRATEKSKELSR
jgi:pyrroline-5-carboxylate reductase